jgi:hypothetical protein
MAFIRVGLFENFKGADTVLIDMDREGLRTVVAWLQATMLSGGRTAIRDCPGSVIQPGLHVDLVSAKDHTGLLRVEGMTFVWRQSEEGWTEAAEKLAAMQIGACHQYLESPQNNTQVIASIGEYGEAWWRDVRR